MTDARLDRRWKRKDVSNWHSTRCSFKESGKIHSNHCAGSDDIVHCEDPDYNKFLQNLKQRGDCYALMVYRDNGEVSEVRYEVDDSLPDEPTLSPPVSPMGVDTPALNPESGAEQVSNEILCGQKTGDLSGRSGKFSTEGGQTLPRCRTRSDDNKFLVDSGDVVPIGRRTRSLAAGNAFSVGTLGRSRMNLGDDDDEEYVRFLNGSLGELDYDQEDFGYADSEFVKLLSCFGDRTGGKSNAGSNSNGNPFVGREFGQGNTFDDANEDSDDFVEDDSSSQGNEFDDVSGGCNDFVERKSEDVCEDYNAFLDRLEVEGEIKDDESEDDSDLVVIEEGMHMDENSTPFVSKCQKQVIDVETYCPVKDSTASRSQFKKELLEILKKPYDSEQHEWCKREVESRKPKHENRNLRGKTKICISRDKFGKSYLDIYSDFAKQIDLAKNDIHKSFNLLRGFFFWLENLTRDGAFRPWDDPSILEVLPQKRH